jgi:hypothetical protein
MGRKIKPEVSSASVSTDTFDSSNTTLVTVGDGIGRPLSLSTGTLSYSNITYNSDINITSFVETDLKTGVSSTVTLTYAITGGIATITRT